MWTHIQVYTCIYIYVYVLHTRYKHTKADIRHNLCTLGFLRSYGAADSRIVARCLRKIIRRYSQTDPTCTKRTRATCCCLGIICLLHSLPHHATRKKPHHNLGRMVSCQARTAIWAHCMLRIRCACSADQRRTCNFVESLLEGLEQQICSHCRLHKPTHHSISLYYTKT